MKKNMILGVAASVFAVGSAFATLAPETAWVLAKLSASETTFTCRQTSVQCNNVGATACQVQVNTTINGGTKIANGRKQSVSCTPVLTDNTGGVLEAPNTFYDVQQ